MNHFLFLPILASGDQILPPVGSPVEEDAFAWCAPTFWSNLPAPDDRGAESQKVVAVKPNAGPRRIPKGERLKSCERFCI